LSGIRLEQRRELPQRSPGRNPAAENESDAF